MKRFSADATIFLFCPWKREKTAPKVAHIRPHFFLYWAANIAKNWKSISEIGLGHPLLYLLCVAHSLLVKWWFYIFFPPLIDAFFRVDEVIKYCYYHLPNFFISSQKRLWFLVFKEENYLFRKVFDFSFSKMKTYYNFTKITTERQLFSYF